MDLLYKAGGVKVIKDRMAFGVCIFATCHCKLPKRRNRVEDSRGERRTMQSVVQSV